MKELRILSPDGQSKVISLDCDIISLGRSPAADLCYPDDDGLSRRHLAIERDGDGWALRDLGSKNGTMLNGARLADRTALKPGDRITAGHLVLVYEWGNAAPAKPVVVFDAGRGDESPHSSTVLTRLDGVMGTGDSPGSAVVLAANHVAALIRAGNELSGSRPLADLFPFILELSIEAVRADRGVLMTLEEGELKVRANRGEGFRISTAVRDRVLNGGLSVLVRDIALEASLRERHSIVEQSIRTLMAVPLQTRDEIIGLIYVDSPSVMREFTKDDLNLLTVMANIAAVRIESVRLAEMEQAERLLAKDLNQAAEIQKSLLPSSAPAIRGMDIAGHNAPCRTVGGDYYDFFSTDDMSVAMALGDVSGKGMPASLLMMGLQARMQVLIEETRNPAEIMTRLNRITSLNCPSNRFISLFFCVLNGSNGDVTFCNAGHNPPLIVRSDGSCDQLKGTGPVLGIVPSAQYREQTVRLDAGDTLVIYSDGVTEATDPNGREFDIPGVVKAVREERASSANATIDAINRALAVWTGGAAPTDDVTLIVVHRIAA